MSVLTVENLNVIFHGKKKDVQIVNDVSFSVDEGQCLCIIGESGSGKSMTTKAVTGLLDSTFEISGKALFQGESTIDLLNSSKETLRNLRGKEISMILQNPMICFDSLYRVGYQMAETFKVHTDWDKEKIQGESVKALEKMMIRQPEEVLRKYPHQLSGGMLQRIMIAIATTLQPKILICDEPTTAIDAITQFEIMKEFQRLKEQETTMIFITHDLGIASLIADKVIVMNHGNLADAGTFQEILDNPKDDYTKLLVEKRKAVMDSYQQVLGVKQ